MNNKVKRYSWHVDAGCMVEETDGAYVESDDYAALEAECERLRNCLKSENAQTEEFERKWYMACDERDALAAELAAIKGQEAK